MLVLALEKKMKVKQIVGEHKKGVRALKYGKKTKGTVPVYGPDSKDAKLKPVKPVGPGQKVDEEVNMTNSSAKVIANDGKTITFAMPDGTQIQKPITPNTLSADKTGKPVVNMNPAAGSPQTMGATQAPQSPEEIFAKGKDVTVNTGEPIEEIGEQPVSGMAPAAPGEAPAQDPAQQTTAQPAPATKTAPVSERKFKEALDAMLTIAGLR